MKLVVTLTAFLFTLIGFSQQDLALGQWKDHLPYNSVHTIVEVENEIYCATQYSVFIYDKSENEVDRLSLVSGLSDFGVSTIAYNKTLKTVIIGYENGNIDLIEDGNIYNLSDIKRSTVLGSKRINKVVFYEGLAYLAMGYGVSVLDIEKKEIKDSYFVGESGNAEYITDLFFDNSKVFASSKNGIYQAQMNSNLSNPKNWNFSNLGNEVSQLFLFNSKLYANVVTNSSDSIYEFLNGNWMFFKNIGKQNKNICVDDNSVYISHYNYITKYDFKFDSLKSYTSYDFKITPRANCVLLGNNEALWVGDDKEGLILMTSTTTGKLIKPNSPLKNTTFKMTFDKDILYAVSGGREGNGNNSYFPGLYYKLFDYQWNSVSGFTNTQISQFYDLIDIAVNPKDENEVYLASMGRGVARFANGEFIEYYNDSNSTLLDEGSNPNWHYVKVENIEFDEDNNLWVTNINVAKNLHVKTPDEKWIGYQIDAIQNTNSYCSEMVIDRNGYKWLAFPEGGIVVFTENGTLDDFSDDQSILLSQSSGHLNSSLVHTLTEDKDGEIWVGTEEGIEVFYSTTDVFSGENKASRVLIEQEGYVQNLLETEVVTAIKVDGANRKWIGTKASGVFLISADGTEELLSFNTDNSPLFSNKILDIEINDNSGEVYFATELGLISYRSDATEGEQFFGEVNVFPNPVKPDFTGNIAIDNLYENAEVKITNLAGNLVYETQALGGQAIWNGLNFNGERASTGVYLIFASDQNGTVKEVAKVLFVN
jgi:hypothetical protein